MAVDSIKDPEQKKDNLRAGARGGFIALALQLTAMCLGFVNQIVLARILGAVGLGEVILALTIINVPGLISAFGMQAAMVRFVPSYVEKNEEAKLNGVIYLTLGLCFFLSVVSCALILFFREFIAIKMFHSQSLLILLPIVVVALPANVINSLIEAILKGYKKTFNALLPNAIIAPSIKLIIFLALMLVNISSFYAIIAFVSGEIIALFFSIMFLVKRMGRIKPVYQWSGYKTILWVASTMIFTNFSLYLYSQADLWIIGMFRSTEEVGVYGVAAKLVTLIAFSLGAFSTIIPTIISSVYTSNDRNELQKVVRESTRWILTMSIPVCLLFIIEGKMFLQYIYGGKFVSGYSALVILSFGQLINAASGLTGWFLQMTGGHRALMKITLFFGGCNIVLNVLFVQRFGIIAAALSTAFTLSMVNIVSVWVIYRRTSILTLAKDFQFDAIFIVITMAFYMLFELNEFIAGLHMLAIVSLIIYVWKSIAYGDLPWRYLTTKSIL